MLRRLERFRHAAWLIVAPVLALLLLSSPAPLLAASTRYIAPSGTDKGNCLNSAKPCKTFNYAISQAAAGDTVSAASGTYSESVSIDKNLTLKGASADTTFLDGGGTIGPLLNVGKRIVAKVSQMTVQNGKRTGSPGAGILNSGTLKLNHVNVTKNNATGNPWPDGAGIYNEGTLKLKKSTHVYDNHADGVGGGIENFGTITVKNGSFESNTAGYAGGGIYNISNISNSGVITLNDVAFIDNQALSDSGGGIFNAYGVITLNDVSFDSNAAHSGGGGIYNGGIYNGDVATLTLTKVTLSSNTALYGGGIANDWDGVATLTNVTLSGNWAFVGSDGGFGEGGGIWNTGGATATLLNVTLGGNTANSGGGIFNSSTVYLKNTIIAYSLSGGNCAGAAVTSQGHNLDNGSSCGLAGSHDQSNVDPQMKQLADNGGYTMTQALKKTSPAIDKGTNKGCPSTDQRGEPRPVDGDGNGKATCDIGAYEYEP